MFSLITALRDIFAAVCRDFEAELVEFDGAPDRVHLLVHYPPKAALSKLGNSFKGISSWHRQRRFPELEQYSWRGKLWSPSYVAGSCGAAPIALSRQYIAKQQPRLSRLSSPS